MENQDYFPKLNEIYSIYSKTSLLSNGPGLLALGLSHHPVWIQTEKAEAEEMNQRLSSRFAPRLPGAGCLWN